MNRREFRRRRIENDKTLLETRRRECIVYERKLEYDMTTKHKDGIMEVMKITLKMVKLEIKELLEDKDKKIKINDKGCRKCIHINECKLRKGIREINQDQKLNQYLIFPEDLAKICTEYKEEKEEELK